MATLSPPRSFSWALTASALAFASALGACQSSADGGDDGDDTDGADMSRGADEDEGTEPARSTETVARVPARSQAPADDEEVATPGGSESEEGAAEAPSEGAAQPVAEATETPVAPAQVFFACYGDSGPYSDCETIYVTVTQASPGRCIQLTIDNCGTYGRQGLSADAPQSWRLAGGSVSGAAEPCEPGVFYSGSASVTDASGSVSWDETTPRPSALELDLTLEPYSASGNAEPIVLATPEPLQPGECEP